MNRHHRDRFYNNRPQQFPRNSSRARSEASDVQPSVEGRYQQPSAAWQGQFPMGPPPPLHMAQPLVTPSPSQPPMQQFFFLGNASYLNSMMPSAYESSQSNPSPSPAPMFPSYSPVPSPACTYPSYSPASVAVDSMSRGSMPREEQNYQGAWSVMHTPVKQVVEPLEQCQNCGYKKPNHFCWECVFISKDGFMKDICHVCNSSDHRYANCEKRLAYEVGSPQRLVYDHYWTVVVRMGKCAVPSAPSFLETWDKSGRITNYLPNSPEFCQQLIHKGSPLGQPRHDYRNFPYTGSPYADQEYLPHDPLFARIRRSLGYINVHLPVTPMTQPRGRRTSDRSRQGRDRRSRSPKSDVVMPDVSRREHSRSVVSSAPTTSLGDAPPVTAKDVPSVVPSAPTTSMGNAPSVISSTATTSLGEEEEARSLVANYFFIFGPRYFDPTGFHVLMLTLPNIRLARPTPSLYVFVPLSRGAVGMLQEILAQLEKLSAQNGPLLVLKAAIADTLEKADDISFKAHNAKHYRKNLNPTIVTHHPALPSEIPKPWVTSICTGIKPELGTIFDRITQLEAAMDPGTDQVR
ncbi:hypothetical protein SCUP234_05758 [Seiridium cupressi]